MSGIVGGIGFDNYTGKRLNFFIKVDYVLRNTNDEVFSFIDSYGAIILTGGLKINF